MATSSSDPNAYIIVVCSQAVDQITKLRLEFEQKHYVKERVDAGVKYQNIVYYKNDGVESIKSSDNVPIDFIKAANEMEKLPARTESNDTFIGFFNKRTNETLQFLRKDQDEWYVDTVIDDGPDWKGYSWGCYADTERVMSTLRLFFEEVPWFGMLGGLWKLRYYDKSKH